MTRRAPIWEGVIWFGGDQYARLEVEQGVAFKELVLYADDGRLVLARGDWDADAQQLKKKIDEGLEALKKCPR